MPSRFLHRIFIFFLCLLMLSFSKAASAQYLLHRKSYRSDSLAASGNNRDPKDIVGSVSVSAYITRPQSYPATDVPQPWEKITPLVDKFQGHKIKRVLVKQATQEVMVFLKGRDPVKITKDSAVQAGLLAPDNYPKPETIKMDSVLYVGHNIRIHINKLSPQNKLIALGVPIDSAENPGEYIVQCNSPRTLYIIEQAEDGTAKRVYEYQVDWLPGYWPADEPGYFPGGIRTMMIDYRVFRSVDSLVLTGGCQFISAQVYYAGNGFSNVITSTMKGPYFSDQKLFLDLCLPGTTVVFDNVKVKDKKMENRVMEGKSFLLIDSTDIRDSYTSLINYPDFPGGNMELSKYLAEKIASLPLDSLSRQALHLYFSFIVDPDGSPRILFDENPNVKDRLSRICYDLILNGPRWRAGSYKGVKTSMITNVTLEIKLE